MLRCALSNQNIFELESFIKINAMSIHLHSLVEQRLEDPSTSAAVLFRESSVPVGVLHAGVCWHRGVPALFAVGSSVRSPWVEVHGGHSLHCALK